MSKLFAEDKAKRKKISAFVREQIKPFAAFVDQQEAIPEQLLANIKRSGYLGATVSPAYGGLGYSNSALFSLNEISGTGCSSFRSMLTVHGMVSIAIEKWGNDALKNKYLPLLASGEKLASFALSEPDAGSDLKQIKTAAVYKDGSYILNGLKKWITFGQISDLFLVFAQVGDKPTALLVDRNTPGFSIKPIKGLLGARGSMLAELTFEQCRVPADNLVGKEGLGLSHVAQYCLDYGRFSVASGCVGLAQACLDESIGYSKKRICSGKLLRKHPLIQKKIAEMAVNIEAARLLCQKAAALKDAGDPQSILATRHAKYFCAKMVVQVASEAVQIHGANGCTNEYPVERYYRDAKINEIIEGSNEIHELLIGINSYFNSRS